MERSVRKAFVEFIQNVQSPEVMKEVAELLGRNDIEGALRIVDKYVGKMAPVLSTVFTQSAIAEADSLEDQVKRIVPTTAISFDPTHPRAAAIMRQRKLKFIADFSQTQRRAVREALATGLMTGAGPLDVAREFRAAIGLAPSQVQAVRNYRQLLQNGSREALERDIRDRRFDNTVRSAVTSGEPLSAKQIDTMVERYRARYVMYRAETIARTETGSVVSAAREEAFNQIKEDADIAEDMVERTWRATKDKRTRDSHRSMDGQTVDGTKTPFVSGHGVRLMRPHDPDAPASEVIQCRCVQTIRIKKPEKK